MSGIAIITARGGSRRIPGKNIRPFCGRPVIAYSIEAAMESGMFSEVMVSTDSRDIASVAKTYGAGVPFFRSRENSDDYATISDVLLEVLDTYKKRGIRFDTACCIFPAAPFVTGEKIKKAMELLARTGAGAVIPVVPFSYPPQRGFLIREDNVRYQYPENEKKRSQDLETIYHDAGQFYCFRVDEFEKYGTLIGPHAVPMILPEMEVQDIDNEDDWKLAELKYRMGQTKETDLVNAKELL